MCLIILCAKISTLTARVQAAILGTFLWRVLASTIKLQVILSVWTTKTGNVCSALMGITCLTRTINVCLNLWAAWIITTVELVLPVCPNISSSTDFASFPFKIAKTTLLMANALSAKSVSTLLHNPNEFAIPKTSPAKPTTISAIARPVSQLTISSKVNAYSRRWVSILCVQIIRILIAWLANKEVNWRIMCAKEYDFRFGQFMISF